MNENLTPKLMYLLDLVNGLLSIALEDAKSFGRDTIDHDLDNLARETVQDARQV